MKLGTSQLARCGARSEVAGPSRGRAAKCCHKPCRCRAESGEKAVELQATQAQRKISRRSTKREVLVASGAATLGALSGVFPFANNASSATALDVASDLDSARQITSKVYLDVELCEGSFSKVTRMGDSSIFCSEGDSVGRIVIGLYGRHVPRIVADFEQLVQDDKGLAGTLFHRILEGKYIEGGRQGARRLGELGVADMMALRGESDRTSDGRSQQDTPRGNPELLESKSFAIPHRVGSVSLALSENSDDPSTRQVPGYQSRQFLIATGPLPLFDLDGSNIVFGEVVEGMDVVSRIAGVRTYQPAERLRSLNQMATFFGDERAANARKLWDRPLQAVVIRESGVLE